MNGTQRAKTIHGFKVEYVAIYRVGKSQYEGCHVYQIEVLVDGDREVYMASKIERGISEAKADFERHLELRRERRNKASALLPSYCPCED